MGCVLASEGFTPFSSTEPPSIFNQPYMVCLDNIKIFKKTKWLPVLHAKFKRVIPQLPKLPLRTLFITVPFTCEPRDSLILLLKKMYLLSIKQCTTIFIKNFYISLNQSFCFKKAKLCHSAGLMQF